MFLKHLESLDFPITTGLIFSPVVLEHKATVFIGHWPEPDIVFIFSVTVRLDW